MKCYETRESFSSLTRSCSRSWNGQLE